MSLEPEQFVGKKQEDAAIWGKDVNLWIVGRAQPRVEGAEKVTGRAQYSYDIRLPGQLYTCILRSPHPHARIRSIDTSRAEALPGVHAVLTSANAPEISWYKEESRLFDTTLRFVGDEVAAVAAESEEIAEDALRLIEVEYEPLPFVLDMEEALKPDAPKIHDKGNLVGEPQVYQRGEPELGLHQAHVVIDQVYTTATALHNSFEPHGCTAHWQHDQLILYESTQSIWAVRQEVAEKLQLPEHRVRVIMQHMGGGFGAKQVTWKQTVIAALLSKQTGRPVQLMLDREAENLAAGNRNATIQRVRLGAKQDGSLTAIVVEIMQAIGAYGIGGEANNVSGIYESLYRCPHVRTEQTGIYINAGPSIAFRAPGYVEGAFGLESAMDELADALQMDPVALRLQNYVEHNQKEDLPYSSPNSLRMSYEQATEAFGWRDYQRPPAQGSKRRGIGFAAHDLIAGALPPAYAWIKLNADGTADVITGTQDIGTGIRTGLTQIAAEELGLRLEDVRLHLGDTAMAPYSSVSAGSATLATVGSAVRDAAVNLRRLLLEAARSVLEEPAEHLQVEDGKIFTHDMPEHAVPVKEVTKRLAPHMLQGHGVCDTNTEKYSVRSFGAQCAEVEVDIATGEVTVLRVVASHDCGRIINPTMVNSQIIGGVTQGVGYALMEERIIDTKRGVVLNPNLEEYKIPTVTDTPTIIHAPIDTPDLHANSTGIKGIGEPPLVPTAPAIANAIYNATGVRLRHNPFNRRRMFTALAEQDFI